MKMLTKEMRDSIDSLDLDEKTKELLIKILSEERKHKNESWSSGPAYIKATVEEFYKESLATND